MESKDFYMEQVNKIPLLKPKEEKLLAEKAYKGDKKAQKKLIESNLRFVVKIAYKYKCTGLDVEDLVNEGNLGLMKAVEKFNPANNTRFTTYAVFWIRESIQKAIRAKALGVRFPSYKYREMKNWKFVSLDAPVAGNDDYTLFHELIEDNAKNPEQTYEERQIHRDLMASIKQLKPKEQKVIKLYYGLTGKEKMTMEEISEFMHCSKAYVGRLKIEGVEKLKKLYEKSVKG